MPSKMVAVAGSEFTAGKRSSAFTTPDGNLTRFLTPSLQENLEVAAHNTSIDIVTTPQLPKTVNDAAGVLDLVPGSNQMGAEGVANPFPTYHPTLQEITNLKDTQFGKGYDSDGNAPLVFDYKNNDADYREDPIKSGKSPLVEQPVPAAVAPSVSVPVTLTDSTKNGIKNHDLRKELKLRGQHVSKNKG